MREGNVISNNSAEQETEWEKALFPFHTFVIYIKRTVDTIKINVPA